MSETQRVGKAQDSAIQQHKAQAPQMGSQSFDLSNAAATVQRAKVSPGTLSAANVMALQQSIGNQAVARLLGRSTPPLIQPKLRVGPVSDRFEQEADQVADQVVRAPVIKGPKNLQRAKDEEQIPQVQLKAQIAPKPPSSRVAHDGSFSADHNLTQRVMGLRGRGAPLPKRIRREMEPRFGADFGGVRIHTGSDAVQMNREMGAHAFTHGQDIAFANDKFQPGTTQGKRLLAHELTHTIQQTGQHLGNVQRLAKTAKNATPLIQRKSKFGTWLSGLFSKNVEDPYPIPPEYVALSAIERQNKAEELIVEAERIAQAAQAKAIATRQTVETNTYSSDQERTDMESVGQMTGDGGAKHKIARHGARRMKKADQRGVYTQTGPIASLNHQVQGLIREVRAASPGKIKLGISDTDAKLNLGKAVKARGLADQMQTQADNLDSGSMEKEVWSHRAHLKDTGSRTFAGAEKSASDAVVNMFDLKSKATGYAEYMKMDQTVLQGHLASKMGELSEPDSLGLNVVKQVVAAGYARSDSTMVEPLSDQTAHFLRVGLTSSGQVPTLEDGVDQTDPVEKGKAIGQDTAKNAGPGILGKQKDAKKTGSKSDIQLDKQVKYLELRAMLHGKSKSREDVATTRLAEVDTLYNQAYQDYSDVDQMKKQTKNGKGTELSDDAVKKAGQAHQKLGKVGVIVNQMEREKQVVYEESQRFRKYVGERAMSKSKRRLKQLGGMVGGIGLRVLTGGLYRIEPEQRGGGYRTVIKSKTMLEDIAKKVVELKALMKGLHGQHGMNKHAMRSYILFKAISFILGVLRDIASGVALWLGLTVVGSPVGAGFATAAFYAGAAKLAIDIMLLVQASIARAKTNDPMSRILLANQQSTMAAEVGSGVGAMGAAGLTMGLSGSTGLLQGQVQQSAFGTDPKLGTSSQFAGLQGLDTKVMGVEVVRKLGDQVALGPTILGALPGVATSDESHKTNMAKYSEVGEKKRSAIKGIKAVFHPFGSGIKALHRFANKSKIAKAGQMAKLGSEVYDQVEGLKPVIANQDQDDQQGGNGI